MSESRRDAFLANATELFGDLQMPAYQIGPEDLRRFTCPCLAVAGSDTLPLFKRVVGVLASNIPGCQFVELAGSGHVTYYEKPAEFAAAVTAFAVNLKPSRI